MPSWTFSGLVFDDHNGNGVQNPGDEGVSGVGVQITTFSHGVEEQSITVTTAGDGTWTGALDAFSDPQAQAKIEVLVGVGSFTLWVATTTSPLTVDLSAAGGGGAFAGNNFGIRPNKQCFTAWSTWIYEVCWLPDKGVAVTFKDRAGAPYFRCYYPNTTFDDFLWYRAQASLGKWEWAVYYHRPYVPLPLGAE
jgi:hypothetical protein